MSTKTAIVDRGGRRVRYYTRADSLRPGQQERRIQLEAGLKWCRICNRWLPKEQVGKNGLCRPHENEQARQRYQDPKYQTRLKDRLYMRKRGVRRMSELAKELVLELFEGKCAYCDNDATTWDHVIPVSKGGQTVKGNMLPACCRCNSSKRDRNIDEWLDKAPMIKPYTMEYLTALGVING